MSIGPKFSNAVPGMPILAADIVPAQNAARAILAAYGDGLSIDQTAIALRRGSRRSADFSMVRVIGRTEAAVAGKKGLGGPTALEGFWDCEEVWLRQYQTAPRWRWVAKATGRKSAKGTGLLWIADLQDAAGRRGAVHSTAHPIPAWRAYTTGTVAIWVGLPTAPPIQRPFVARVTAAAVLAPNRWAYTLREVERRSSPAGVVSWADTTTDPMPGRTVTARNLAEEANAATGIQGHGVNVTAPGFPPGMTTQPVPIGSIVMAYPITVIPGGVGLPEATEYVFERGNGVDGTC